MMWEYVSFPDETTVAYSDLCPDGTVRVAVERPIDMGFDSAQCTLPAYVWSDVEGFSPEEVARLDTFLRDNAPLIFDLAERRAGEKVVA